jgi:hypothetical protein
VAADRPSFEDVDWRLRGLDTSGWRGLVATHRQQKTMNVLEVRRRAVGPSFTPRLHLVCTSFTRGLVATPRASVAQDMLPRSIVYAVSDILRTL